MKLIIAALLAASSSTGALAQTTAPKSDPTDTGKLTIVEVLNIGQALRQMGDYYRAGGEKVAVPFKFDGTTLMTFGINVRAADDTEKAYRDAYLRFEQQELGDVKDASPEEVQKKKQAIATSDAAKRMIERPAGALLARIKESELCMKDPPVKPCTVKNDLSPGQIAALLPIIDRGQ
jgi:hypothetical protein